MAIRVDINNVNTSLLDAINNVRRGNDTDVTIKYYYSNIENNLPSTISMINFKADVEMAFLQWKLFFNSLYTSNRVMLGNLNLNFEESSSEGIKIEFSSVKYISGSSDSIKLNSNVKWTFSFLLKANPVLSAMVYAIGRSIGFPTTNTNSPMSLKNAKLNFASLSSLSYEEGYLHNNGLKNYKSLIKSVLYIYGHINNTNDIVYGCTDPKAENYNKKANRSDRSCNIVKNPVKDSSIFKPAHALNKSYKVLMSNRGYGTLDFKGLNVDKENTFNL